MKHYKRKKNQPSAGNTLTDAEITARFLADLDQMLIEELSKDMIPNWLLSNDLPNNIHNMMLVGGAYTKWMMKSVAGFFGGIHK